MSQFGKIKHGDHIDDIMNFQTFPNALLLLFRLTTAAGWNDVMYPMLVSSPPDCNNTHWQRPDGRWEKTEGGNCSNSLIAVIFMFTYIFITYLIIINMYIAIILENFHQAHDQEEVGITEDDFDMFYVVWEKYDPHATQFIKYEHLSDFVGDLDPPLGISKPNEIALVSFDLPIVEGDRLHCLDILIALVRHVLGEVEVTNEFQQLKQQMETKFKEQFPTRVQFLQTTTTMRRKKEDVAARTLQRAWKKHKAEVSIRRITQMAMDQKNKSLTRSSSIWSQRRDSQASQTGSFAVAQRRASKLSNRLKVPIADTSISLPSEKNEDDL